MLDSRVTLLWRIRNIKKSPLSCLRQTLNTILVLLRVAQQREVFVGRGGSWASATGQEKIINLSEPSTQPLFVWMLRRNVMNSWRYDELSELSRKRWSNKIFFVCFRHGVMALTHYTCTRGTLRHARLRRPEVQTFILLPHNTSFWRTCRYGISAWQLN